MGKNNYPDFLYKRISTSCIHAVQKEEVKYFKSLIESCDDDTDMDNLFNSVSQLMEQLPGGNGPDKRTREQMLRLCAALQHYVDVTMDEIADSQFIGGKIRQEKPDCSPAGERE